MQKSIKGLLCLPALFVTACQSIPLQEDLTRVSTVEITTHILCEMKTVLESKGFKNFAHKVFRNQGGYVENEYAVSFDFDFSARQKNKKNADLNLVFPVALGTLSIGLEKGDIEDENYSQEKFKITKGFGTFSKLSCDQIVLHPMLVQQKAGALPIRGTIGLDEVLHQYFILRHLRDTKLENFSRNIQFKVTSNLGTKGTVSLERANGEKIEANAGASGNRIDWHQLTLTIAHTPPDTRTAEEKRKAFEKERTYFIVVRDRPVTEETDVPKTRPGAKGRQTTRPKMSAPIRPTTRQQAEEAASRQLDQIQSQKLLESIQNAVERNDLQ